MSQFYFDMVLIHIWVLQQVLYTAIVARVEAETIALQDLNVRRVVKEFDHHFFLKLVNILINLNVPK